MANTVSIDALRPEIWQKELFADRKDVLFFENKALMGSSDNSVIQVKSDLKKSKGDAVTFGLTAKLSGSGVTGDAELEGNEEAINSYAEQVAIDQIRFGVRLTGKLDEQKAAYDMRKDAKDKLSIIMAEFIENQIFMKLGGVTNTACTRVDGSTIYSARATFSNTAPIVPEADQLAGTGDRYICTDASGVDSLAATDILTTNFITRAKVKAQLANPRIAPLRIDGQDYYVMFIHPWQAADLKTASGSTWAQAQRDAQNRGSKNPIFTGALGVWDGVILHAHEYVPTCASGGDFIAGDTAFTAMGLRALLCGKQAGVMAESSKSMMMVEEQFDYQNKVGYAINFIGGIQKPAFNSLDYGVIAVDSGATDIG